MPCWRFRVGLFGPCALPLPSAAPQSWSIANGDPHYLGRRGASLASTAVAYWLYVVSAVPCPWSYRSASWDGPCRAGRSKDGDDSPQRVLRWRMSGAFWWGSGRGRIWRMHDNLQPSAQACPASLMPDSATPYHILFWCDCHRCRVLPWPVTQRVPMCFHTQFRFNPVPISRQKATQQLSPRHPTVLVIIFPHVVTPSISDPNDRVVCRHVRHTRKATPPSSPPRNEAANHSLPPATGRIVRCFCTPLIDPAWVQVRMGPRLRVAF